MPTSMLSRSPYVQGLYNNENIPPPHPNMDSEYPSPSTSRHVPLLNPSPNRVQKEVSLDQGNDDAAELKARRRSRVLEIQRQRLASSPVNNSDTDKSRTTPLSNLSNAQVAAHYRDCIKLSAENKINAKNAFGLHLIDYMSDLIKKKELDNFQIASSTLDASAKIYAGRVDAIHSDMFKVLGGLGTSNKRVEGTDGGEGEHAALGSEMGSPGSQEDKGKRVKKKRTKKIKANVKTITVDSYNLEFDVDPLFKKTSATFDEGGTSGLLLNNLPCNDNTSELVLDSESRVIGLGPHTPLKRQELTTSLADFNIRETFTRIRSSEICPEFNDFTFSNWSSENEQLYKSLLEKDKQSKHAFDLDAEVEPIPMDDLHIQDDFIHDHDMAEPESDNESTGGELVQEVRVDKEAQLVNTVMQSIKHGNIGDLMQVLTTENDYSHFSTSVLNTWAGPSLWHMKAGTLVKQKQSLTEEQTDKSKRKRKAPLTVDLDKECDFKEMNETKASTTVKEARLNEYSKSKTTLPADLRVDAEEIFKRGLKDGLVVRRKRSVRDVEDGVANYDYDNTNDANNFCTAVDDDDDDHDPGLSSQDSQESLIDNTAIFPGADSTLNFTQAQLGMIDQPKRVAKLEIDYAKTAKKIDVKRLKASMWRVLSNDEKKDEEKLPLAPGEQASTSTAMPGETNFSNLVQQLPSKVPKNMVKNLSAPICFVCLLHLVNEKKLSIEGNEDLSDFKITQG